MRNTNRHLIYAWIIFIFSEVVAALMIYSLYSFHIDEQGWIQKKSLYQTHAVGMPICLIIINGHGMVVFRLLPGVNTRFVKYIHGLIHTIVIGLFLYLSHIIYVFKEKSEHPILRLGDFHSNQAYLTMGSYIVQWISACFVFVYMYSNQRRRKVFAAWHNFVGICILQLSIATSCCMLQWEEHHSSLLKCLSQLQHEQTLNYVRLDLESTPPLQGAIASALMVLYGLLINVLVLNPYLEWPLIGPI